MAYVAKGVGKSATQFKAGQSGNPNGRPKDSKNALTLQIKDMILNALDKAGGVDYLVAQADKNPTAFLTLVGKVLPLQVDAEHSGTIVAQVIFKGLND
jgi:hypothetical protein